MNINKFSHRGIPPYKFKTMPGTHNRFTPDAAKWTEGHELEGLVRSPLDNATKRLRSGNKPYELLLDLMPDATDARSVKDQIYKWEFMLERKKGEK